MKLSCPASSFLPPILTSDCFDHAERLELRGSRLVRRAPWRLGRAWVVVVVVVVVPAEVVPSV